MNRVMFSSATCEWATPAKVFEDLDREFCFDFDPCPQGGANDGLSPLFMPWYGSWCECCGWVDENSLYYIHEGVLKVRSVRSVLEGQVQTGGSPVGMYSLLQE